MNEQLFRLNCLRSDFKKWADSNEPSVWELDVNKISENITGYSCIDEPVILLDCTENTQGNWFLCINTNVENENGCYSIEDLPSEQIYDIRRIVESYLAKKDILNFYI
jgi:hypothetical protein